MRTNGVGYSGMLQRNGVFFFRKVVPVALRAIVGKREFLVSLKTRDREQAKRNLHREALKADATLAAARRQLEQQTPETLAERWKHDLLREDAETRSAFKPKTKADLDSEIADLDATLAEVRSYLTLATSKRCGRAACRSLGSARSTREKVADVRCGIGSCSVPRPSLGDHVAGTGPRGAADAAGEC